jgi:hypothetical protein
MKIIIKKQSALEGNAERATSLGHVSSPSRGPSLLLWPNRSHALSEIWRPGAFFRASKPIAASKGNPNPHFHSVHTAPHERVRELRATTVWWERRSAPARSVAADGLATPTVSSPVPSCGGAASGSVEGINGDAFKSQQWKGSWQPWRLHTACIGWRSAMTQSASGLRVACVSTSTVNRSPTTTWA